MPGPKRSARVIEGLAVLVATILVGVLLAVPVSAHREAGESHRHLFKRLDALGLVSASEGDARYLKKGQKASNADLLDGKDSTDLQGNCEQGAVLAAALINGGDVIEDPNNFSATGVVESFSCFGDVEVLSYGPGIYEIDFGVRADRNVESCGDGIFNATLTGSPGFIIAESQSFPESPDQQFCDIMVETWDAEGSPADRIFNVTVYAQEIITLN